MDEFLAKIKTLNASALSSLRAETVEQISTLTACEAPTDDQVGEALRKEAEVDAIDAEVTARAAQAEKFAALKTRNFSEEKPEDSEEKPEEEGKPDDEADDKADDREKTEDADESDGDNDGSQAVDSTEVAEGVAAALVKLLTAASEDDDKPRSRVAALSSRTKRPQVTTTIEHKPLAITAAADSGFATGEQLDSLTQVAEAAIHRANGFPVPAGTDEDAPADLRPFGTAKFGLDYADDLVVDDWIEAQEVFHAASQESRLPGGSLVAAGGWCSPSETVYDLDQDATTEGMLSLPEVGVRRGGIRYAQSPVFADFYANPGFKQTEAQAIAGNTKPCVEVTCPGFTDVRLDVVGLCIKVPILTNAAYPEVVRNFISGTMVAHQHWVNADVISRIETFAGAARVFTGVGSTVADSLEALELVIIQRRQMYRLGLKQTMEVLLPFWYRGAARADLAKRNGRSTPAAVSDAEIDAHFNSIGANVQWLYDWQGIDETAEVYPATVNAIVYPAGTFVKGTSNVINLNTVYDAASLAVNVYTGLFAEQGLLVAKMKFGADLVTLPVANYGRMGALDITAAP